jgi:DNA-binding NarL/FixJ family response regulator
VRLLLTGEHVLLLQGLVKLLGDQPGADIRAATRPDEAEESVRVWRPEVVIFETSNVPAAIERLEGLCHAAEDVPLLVIGPAEREQFLAALRAGARAYVGRDATAERLLGCIEAVRRGEWGVPRALVGVLAEAYVTLANAEVRPSAQAITERERRVLELLTLGASVARIGQELFLSEGTVRSDIRALTRKLGVANRVQLVAEAMQRGLTSAG